MARSSAPSLLLLLLPELLLLLLLAASGSVSGTRVILEADVFAALNGISSQFLMDRSNSRNMRNVYLHKGDYLFINFCVPASRDQLVTLIDVVWANDGWKDVVDVSLDGTKLGSFTTNDETDMGQLWNTMYHSGTVGFGRWLKPGNHTLRLDISQADPYGMEIDYLVLDFSDDVNVGAVLCDGILSIFPEAGDIDKEMLPIVAGTLARGSVPAPASTAPTPLGRMLESAMKPKTEKPVAPTMPKSGPDFEKSTGEVTDASTAATQGFGY